MPLSRSRDYLSIGEVLESVRDDFPDISISKIRFLESEGLLEPERTSSGYRKFYDKDIARLRYVLSLQKEHFLPLKVIKEKLQGGEVTAPASAPVPVGSAASTPAPAGTTTSPVATDVSLDRLELAQASGLSEDQLASLEDFGIIEPNQGTYAGSALVIARAARGFFEHGIEARHLRMFRQIVDREVGFYEQVVSPVTRRKDPDALRAAQETVQQLAALGQTLRGALLQESLARTTSS